MNYKVEFKLPTEPPDDPVYFYIDFRGDYLTVSDASDKLAKKLNAETTGHIEELL